MKKIVVTDPCYIMSEEDWDACVKEAEQCETEHKAEWRDAFDAAVCKKLEEISGHKAYATDTGFGDWNNCIAGQDFCADTGMVCVCYLTESMKDKLDSYPNQNLAAIIDVEGDISVGFDCSRSDWTVVEIEDSAHNHWMSWIPDDEDDE